LETRPPFCAYFIAVILDTNNATNDYDRDLITIANCANGSPTTKTRSGLDFLDGLAATGHNINVNSTTCTSPPAAPER
jgi:hypothetical protein